MRSKPNGSIESVRRKLRAVAALTKDIGATEHERANAEGLKTRLEKQLKDAGVPKGDWTDNAFRFGRWAKRLTNSGSPISPARNWTDDAFRFGRALRHGYKRWLSQ